MPLTDLLYFDRKRIRRLLGELEGGVVESAVNQVGGKISTQTTARLFKSVEEGPESTQDLDVAELITFDDALLSIAEEAFGRSGLLEAPVDLGDPKNWRGSAVHDALSPAQLLRLHASTQIVDPAFFADSVSRVMAAVESMALFSIGLEAIGAKGAKDRERMARAAATKLMGGLSPELGRQLGEAIRLYFGDEVILRQLPCGDEHRTFAFAGVLAKDGSLLDTRGGMYAKYGAAPSQWTVLSQIATVTSEPTASEGDGDSTDEQMEDVDRAEFEKLAAKLMVGLEEAGIAGGPRWPTITVTPLAVYRRAA
jgi:hypothetical protein